MFTYAIKRLTLLPLSLFVLSLLCYGLRQLAPDDGVHRLLPTAESRLLTEDPTAYDRAYRRAAASLGVDKPAFYFSLENAALPDTLHRVVQPEQRAMLRALTLFSGDWAQVQGYFQELREMAYGATTADSVRVTARQLLVTDKPQVALNRIARLPDSPEYAALRRFAREFTNPKPWTVLLPALRWRGFDNQYHRWLMATLSGDFGVSLVDRRPVTAKIKRALGKTALLNGLALLVVYLVSLPLGLYMAGYRGSWFDRLATFTTFLLFGVPSFWLATLLANFFTTPAFGMDFFPSMGFGEVPPGASFWSALRIKAAHLFLPVMCMAYPSWAYVSRQLRNSAVGELSKAYVKTAQLKGLGHGRILWGHVLRNASFPIITLLGGILPALLAGSILIERIFNLPGMGQLLYRSALAADWPVVITLVLLNGLLTALGLLLTDFGYALADPRVRLGAQRPAA